VTQQPSWPGQPVPAPPAAAPPRAGESWTPERVDPLPGTGFGLVQLHVPPITSGLAIGSLVAGIAAVLVSTLVLCFGLVASESGSGALVAGAFALLSVLAGAGATAVGLVARRQIRRSGQAGRVRFTGSGVAMTGIICGAGGAAIAVLTFVLVLLVELS
jgi:hypothetical protein